MSNPIAIVRHKRTKALCDVLSRTTGGWYVRFPDQAGIQWKSDLAFARNFTLVYYESSFRAREVSGNVEEIKRLEAELASALDCLRAIAAMKTVSKRQRINSEAVITWLYAHGYALEAGGYVPGVGFKEST